MQRSRRVYGCERIPTEGILSHTIGLPITAKSDTEKYHLRASKCQQGVSYSPLQFITPPCGGSVTSPSVFSASRYISMWTSVSLFSILLLSPNGPDKVSYFMSGLCIFIVFCFLQSTQMCLKCIALVAHG